MPKGNGMSRDVEWVGISRGLGTLPTDGTWDAMASG